jgi:RNA polymerase sigma factor (sigma-70 family)
MHQLKEEPRPWMPEPPPAELPDAHLVRMAQRDPAAFVHLYDRYVSAVYRYCLGRLPVAAAEDATSIAFLNALRALDRFDQTRVGFRPWLFAIAHNAVIDQTRIRRHEPIDELAIVDPADSLDDRVVAIDQRQSMLRAIAQLPSDQQQAIQLRLSSLTGPEIAEVMGRSHEAVRALQHRAIRRLRSLISPSMGNGHEDD